MNVRRPLRTRRLSSAAGSINSGRHILAFTMRRALRKRRVFDFVPSYRLMVFPFIATPPPHTHTII